MKCQRKGCYKKADEKLVFVTTDQHGNRLDVHFCKEHFNCAFEESKEWMEEK